MTDETPASPPSPTPGATLSAPQSAASVLAGAKALAERNGIEIKMPFAPLANQHVAPTAEARTLAAAATLTRGGTDPERVKQAMAVDGVDPALLDQRTPEQRRHDEQHGMPHAVDPKTYYFSLPPAAEIGNPAAFNVDLRQVTAELGLTTDRGNQFATMIVGAVRSAAADPDRAATAQRHDAQLRAAFGSAYEAKVKAVNSLLDDIGENIANKAFVKQMRPDGLIGSRPFVFAMLANRAAAIAAWRAGRPK